MASPSPAAPLRIILPLLPGIDLANFGQLAGALAGSAGELILLGVVVVQRGEDLPEAAAEARSLRRTLTAFARTLPAGTRHQIFVRAADSLLAGVQQAASDLGDLLLLGLPDQGAAHAFESELYRSLLAAPPIDAVFARIQAQLSLHSVLVSARGGPYAELALEIAQRLARARGAAVTVMHVDDAGTNSFRRQREQQLFHELLARSGGAGRIRSASRADHDVVGSIMAEAGRHDLLVLGTRVAGAGDTGGPGAVPLAALERDEIGVLLVKARGRVDPAIFRRRGRGLDDTVNDWIIENTSHCRDYSDLDHLLAEKQRLGCTIGVGLLDGGSKDTLAAHARVLCDELSVGVRLLDEVVFVCGDEDTAEAARTTGLDVEIVPDAAKNERGRLLHAALRRMRSDIIVWLDGDTRNPHQKVVYGLLGPLLLQPHLRFVKGFFGVPRDAPDSDLRVLAGELSARPLLDLYFPELAGFIAPLAVEQAHWRAEALASGIFSGPAAPLGLLLDAVDRLGLSAVAQVGLDEHVARPLDLDAATAIAFSAVQILSRRAGLAPPALPDSLTVSLKRLHVEEGRFQISMTEAAEVELPPRAAGPA